VDAQGLTTHRQIGLDLAQAIIAGVRAEAERIDAALAIVVADRAGNGVAMARMDGAALGASELAANKAHTSALWELRSGDLGASTAPGGDDWGLTTTARGRIVVYAGGVPVHVDGALVGAVGASGGTAAEDEACVLDGLEAAGLGGR
jgi:uncharacterized protein GlcG (DUF336 family)